MNTKKVTVGSVFLFLVLAAYILIVAYPFLYMVSTSLSDPLYIMQNKITFYPRGLNFNMYKYILHDPTLFTAYKNTLIYVILGTIISLSFTCTAAYGLSKRRRLIFAKVFNILILIPMFFSGGMIPQFLNVKDLGLIDTIWAMILVPAVNVWFLIIARSFFSAFPSEIEDAGFIDGLKDFGVFFHLVLPTSKALLATMGLFYGERLWNTFLLPYLYLQSPSKYPLQVALRNMVLQGQIEQGLRNYKSDVIISDGLKFATIIFSIIPIVIVYPFIQKYFVKGVMLGSIKA